VSAVTVRYRVYEPRGSQLARAGWYWEVAGLFGEDAPIRSHVSGDEGLDCS